MKKAVIAAAAVLCLAAAGASAQRVHQVPRRPVLFAGADTNSAGAYYLLGMQQLERDAEVAAAAFYWAERLAPGWPDALYGRHTALLMIDPRRQASYVERRGGTPSAEIQAIDSLYLRAVQRDPFLHKKLERQFMMQYYRTAYAGMVTDVTGNRNDALANHLAQQLMNDPDPANRAWLAYSDGRFPAAITHYEQALRRTRNPASMRLLLGQIHYLAGNYPQAEGHLRGALEELRKNDRRQVVRVYESKAMVEFSLAAALLQEGKADSAREGFGRALQEDLAFWPGHRSMSNLALQRGDTTTALAEMGLAAELAPNEADVHYSYGEMLMAAGKIVEAAAEMNRAIALDPYFPSPHLLLAAMHDASSMSAEAREHYRVFLSLAPRDHPQRARAEQRLQALAAQ